MLRKVLLFLVALLFAMPALAVELKGQIKGEVVDSEGLAIPGATIVVTSPALQGQAGDVTNEDGRFRAIGLPPGEYKVEVTKPGFNTWRGTDVRVALGSTVTLTITLNVAVAGEEIVVEAVRPTVDVTSSSTGVTVSDEMLRDIPNPGRDYQGAITMAAGVVGGGNPNMAGGFDSGNQYYLDGVNTTDPLTNTFSMNMNFDAIEEVQVITGGLDAEYGRSMGGAVNIVTKSGGNEFEGTAQLLYSSDATRLYKALPDENKEDQDYTSQHASATLGGPILRDQLWFFSSLEFIRYLSTESVPESVGRDLELYPMPSRDWMSTYMFGKLTWKPTANHQVTLHAQSDPTRIKNANQDPYGLPSSEIYWEQGGWLTSLRHLWTPSSSTILDSQVSYQKSNLSFIPMSWLDCNQWSEDGLVCEQPAEVSEYQWFSYDPDGFSVGESPYVYYTDRSRIVGQTALTKYFSFLGEHEVKVGGSVDFVASNSIYPGLEQGMEYWSYEGNDPMDLDSYSPYMLVAYNSNLEKPLSGMLETLYVQDVYKPLPRLTLRPGVRMDASQFMDDLGDQVYSTINFAPRLGAAWDIMGDHRWNLHVYYGRIYDPGFLGISNILAKVNQGLSYYMWDEETGAWGTDPVYTVSPNFLVSPDLKSPYTDEIDAGLAKDLGNDWWIQTNLVYKRGHNYFEDDEVNAIWNADGTDVIGFRNGEAEQIYRLRTPDEIYYDYRAVTVQMGKQFSEKWGMVGSYTWSHAYGFQADSTASGLLDIPEQIKYEEGVLGYDVPHYVKTSGSYRDDSAWSVGERVGLGYLLGWDFLFRAGYPYRKVYYNAYEQGWGNVYGDNDYPDRLPAVSTTDLKAGLTVKVGETKFDITAECFNVFNSREVVGVNTVYDDESGEIYTDSNGDVLYGTPTARLDPRYFQFGLRGEF